MSRSRFTEEQIIAVLREAEAGAKVQELCRKHGISDTTLYRWRSKHEGQKLSESRRFRRLKDENQRLRSLVADLTLRNEALKSMASKKW